MAEKSSRRGCPEGGSFVENVRLNRSKRKILNSDYAKPRIKVADPTNEKRTYRCCMCGHEYGTQKGNFLSGGKSVLWRGNGGFVPFCRSCCEILMESMVSFYSGNEEHALRHMCSMFDWYYSETASAAALGALHATRSYLGAYASKMNITQVVAKGTSFCDTLLEEYNEGERMFAMSQADASQENDENEFTVTREMIRTWGKGFTPDQYQFLEEEFTDWTTKSICKTKAQEELFRNIALAQLDVRIARETGGKVTDAQKALQDLMNSANILPKQNADNILADTQTFGTLLKKYEETDPIPEPDERWRDVDGIRRYMNTWFRGGLAKALKINNENTAMYDDAVKEMDRYTVHPTDIRASEVANDASIFDQGEADKGGDGNER